MVVGIFVFGKDSIIFFYYWIKMFKEKMRRIKLTYFEETVVQKIRGMVITNDNKILIFKYNIQEKKVFRQEAIEWYEYN